MRQLCGGCAAHLRNKGLVITVHNWVNGRDPVSLSNFEKSTAKGQALIELDTDSIADKTTILTFWH